MLPEDLLFQSFIQAGFECSTHKRRDGSRLDLINSTGHEDFVATDYHLLHRFGIRTVRESARWHLIEAVPGTYCFDSLSVLLDAAAATDTEVLLDLLHFGWPDHVDVFSSDFIQQFSKFSYAVAHYLKRRSDRCRLIAPVNEFSFLSWAGADVASINPYTVGRGADLKRNLVRAAAAASEILLNELPGVRLLSPEPVIHIVGNPEIAGDDVEAEQYRLSQFEAWDMLSGRLAPELGGHPEYLDILGLNFYERNEWVHNDRKPLARTDPRYRHFRHIIREVSDRYARPMFVSETGTEDGARAEWFNYVCNETVAALEMELPVHGICLYPILNHPGWEDDRHCHNGLFDYPDAAGMRNIHWPLAHAIRWQQRRFLGSNLASHESYNNRPDLPVPSPLGFRLSTAPTPHESVRPKSQSLLF